MRRRPSSVSSQCVNKRRIYERFVAPTVVVPARYPAPVHIHLHVISRIPIAACPVKALRTWLAATKDLAAVATLTTTSSVRRCALIAPPKLPRDRNPAVRIRARCRAPPARNCSTKSTTSRFSIPATFLCRQNLSPHPRARRPRNNLRMTNTPPGLSSRAYHNGRVVSRRGRERAGQVAGPRVAMAAEEA